MKSIVSGFRKFSNGSNKVLTVISDTVMAALVITVALQIFARYLFGVYFAWTEETSRYLMFWAVLLGAAKALQVDAHPKVTFISEGLIKGKGTHICRILASVASAIFYIILIIYGWKFSMMNLSQLSLSLRLPMTFIFIAMPVGGFFLLVNTIVDILRELGSLGVRSLKEGEEE